VLFLKSCLGFSRWFSKVGRVIVGKAKKKGIVFLYTRNLIVLFEEGKRGYFAVFKKLCALANFSKMDVGDNNQEIGLSLMFTQSAYVSFLFSIRYFFQGFKVFICRLFSDVH